MIAGGKNNLIGISGKIGSGKDTVGSMLYRTALILVTKSKSLQINLKIQCVYLLVALEEQLEDREFKEKELGEEWKHTYYNIIDNQGGKLDTHLSKEDAENDLSFWDENINIAHPPSIEKIEQNLSPRKLLQLLGTECGRQIIHPNIWVNALFADYVCDNCGHDPECPIQGNDYNITYRKDYPNTEESLIQYGGGSEAEVLTREIEQSNWIITDVRFPNEAQAIKDRGGIVMRVNRPLDRPGNSKLPKLKHTAVDSTPFRNSFGRL